MTRRSGRAEYEINWYQIVSERLPSSNTFLHPELENMTIRMDICMYLLTANQCKRSSPCNWSTATAAMTRLWFNLMALFTVLGWHRYQLKGLLETIPSPTHWPLVGWLTLWLTG